MLVCILPKQGGFPSLAPVAPDRILIALFGELLPMFRRLLTLLAVASTALFAQTASITGRITDPGGAVVPDATITVQSTNSGVSTTAKSNDEGYYSLPALNPGAYDLTVMKPGFAVLKQTGLVLAVQ